MSYLNCSRCGLSLLSRNPQTDPEYCPRCVARARVLQPLFRSPLSLRALAAGETDQATPAAGMRRRGAAGGG